jgi:putative endonuclease
MSSLEQKREFEKTGRRAESWAAMYLRLKGYKILERNFRNKSGEVDIIVRKRDVIAAVEVKQRRTLSAAHESISAESERRISNALESYVSTRPQLHNCGQRCDAIFFIGERLSLRRITHIEDAF